MLSMIFLNLFEGYPKVYIEAKAEALNFLNRRTGFTWAVGREDSEHISFLLKGHEMEVSIEDQQELAQVFTTRGMKAKAGISTALGGSTVVVLNFFDKS